MASDKQTLLAVLQLLRRYNLKSTEELLKKEANLTDVETPGETPQTDSEVSSVLSAYKSEGDPDVYEDAYVDLKKFVEGALDIYKHELGMILYPVFVHMYLELVYNGHEQQAIKLMEKFGPDQEEYYQDDLKRLSHVTKKDHMKGNELTDTFKSSEFIIRMSRDTLSILKRHLQEKKHSVVLNIIQEHLYFDMYEGVARNKQQIEATSGAVVGEATRQDNKAKVYYGLLKEPDIQYLPVEEEEEADADNADKPKKKKPKKDPLFSKKAKSDPNAPPPDRMPLPDLKDADKVEKAKAMREASKRVTLGPDSLPSICFYTLLNSHSMVTSAEIAEDSSLLAVGFADSVIKIWTLVPQKLRAMKSAEQLQDIDREAEDVWVRMMDDRSAETSRVFHGHTGPVYRVAFSPDRSLLLSCSEDTTVRLWSLQTWTCLVCYKGHCFPVWDVRFAPHGYYFATAGHDKTARLWATDQHQPLRIFAGHFSDVDCVQFHPNSNYVATGSSDRTVRLWDCVTGSHVRLMTGHKAPIYSLSFSVEGRFLASAGSDYRVLIWDLAHGHLLAELSSHTAPIHSLAFSRDGHILTSGSLDCSIKLWDFTRLVEEMTLEDVNVSHNPDIKKSESYLLRSYGTKNSGVLGLHFTRRNLLLAVGIYDS
ncbi:transcription initiation factor TFIID subunit 5 [Schistocerca americana]|uniref:transcription initiation factor TFIID subunit 5 n=1 Tax=Schistocerca americana TaxID=7009 RepID=UPI001F4FF65A|nr:transcription initiation factor TFIID subunit 5 [Schistocerca americana]XP_047107434.1 transcription initiation factor TFIID subunit 5 [Schistocerca piceifrons]XP_049773796.1 transcription initiation factor TFIID subunit 5 [Schistocerca cancellata]XP_049802767.1 transcription initiation factor TFIID subunit 5 [Schistocerca nitens]XP_049949293.1 transcription initiation factor TFIID subunit 5 [Schistocerca serialis cubense]